MGSFCAALFVFVHDRRALRDTLRTPRSPHVAPVDMSFTARTFLRFPAGGPQDRSADAFPDQGGFYANHYSARACEESDDIGRNPTDNPTIGDVIAARFDRRDILKGALGVAAIAATVSPLALAAADGAQAQSGFALPLRGARSRRRRKPSRGSGLRRRGADPLGRSGAAGRAAVQSEGANRRRATPAVRLQQRLSRLFPDAGRGQSVDARLARGQP